MFWTDQRIEALRTLWDRGDSASEIAAQIGGTKNQVIGKAHRLFLTPRVNPIKPPPPEPELSNRVCEYPFGHKPNIKYCRKPVRLGSSYCPEHHNLCYRGYGET